MLAARPHSHHAQATRPRPSRPPYTHTQVDSADTPEQLSRLLDEVKDAGAKRVLLVFGCPGTTTPEERAAMLQVGGRVRPGAYLAAGAETWGQWALGGREAWRAGGN